MVERSLVHAGTPHGRCLFHSLTAPKITGTRALAPSRVHHPSPERNATPARALQTSIPSTSGLSTVLFGPRNSGSHDPQSPDQDTMPWARGQGTPIIMIIAGRARARRRARCRPARAAQPPSWLVMQSLSSESFHALLHLVHRIGNGLHRCSIRDTQAVGVAERLAGHEGQQEVFEQVETDVIRVG